MEREFQIFVKPVGACCNLNCSYCYYLGKRDLYKGLGSLLMDEDVLEKYIISHIEATTNDLIMFSWHGGEPLLAGKAFYKKALEIQTRNRPAGKTILNGIQTNGTLIDEEWAQFIAEENFIVGISLDGPEEFHNRHRRDNSRGPTFTRVMHSFDLLMKHGVVPEILCVLSSFNSGSPLKIYDFFRSLSVNYLTFLPLVVRNTDSGTGTSPDSVSAEAFGNFLIAVFDEWVEKDIGKIKIQIFEEAARTAFDLEHTLCIFKKECGGVPVVEHNGDFYACDHYVNREHFAGNINERSIAEMLDSPEQKEFGNKKLITLPRYCIECPVRSMCNGECPKNRFINTPGGEAGLNYLCSGYRKFFIHCLPFIEALRIAWLNEQ